jgi:hypothetical protein
MSNEILRVNKYRKTRAVAKQENRNSQVINSLGNRLFAGRYP